MMSPIELVEEFHEAFNIEMAKEPALLPEKEFILRHKLMTEENKEYLDACWEGDLVGIADALGDQLYILLGTILKHGLNEKMEDVFAEIHRSNMSKLGPDGKPILRGDGKILKGPAYFKPNIHKIIYEE
jgi:predicted HAD superfamily Cof-like phosphohydrolase